MLKNMTSGRSKSEGFTLIELMIAVAIIGILASIALPAYRDYVLASRRIDAKNALAEIRIKQEKYRGNNPSYTKVLADLGIATSKSPQGFYTITIDEADATDYQATASVDTSSAQKDDAGKCPSLVVTKGGFKGGDKSDPSCWGL